MITMNKKTSFQVKDDPGLLDLMMEDVKNVSNLYKPTNFWSVYEKNFLPEIKSLGLMDFRRRNNSILTEFGATDLLPLSEFLRNPSNNRFSIKMLQFLLKGLSSIGSAQKLLYHISKANFGIDNHDINSLCFEFTKFYGEKNGARSIHDFEGSLVGNPESFFYVDNMVYTISLLYYYIQYAYCCKFMNFDSIGSIAEIGSGLGKQVEIIKKLHPQINFFVFDLPPQLYVCEQYLSSIFPDSVISYRETRTMENIPEQKQGKIFIFGNWKISELKNLNYDLFWNSVSFQEMEPEVVSNYLKYVNLQARKYIFLQEKREGKKIAAKKGDAGVLKQTKFSDYEKGLSNFQLQDLSDALRLPRLSAKSGSDFTFWKKISHE